MRIWTYSENWTTKLKWIKWTGMLLLSFDGRSLASLMLVQSSNTHTSTFYVHMCNRIAASLMRCACIQKKKYGVLPSHAVDCAPSEHWIHFCLHARASPKWSGRGEFNECGEFVASWRLALFSFVYLFMVGLAQGHGSFLALANRRFGQINNDQIKSRHLLIDFIHRIYYVFRQFLNLFIWCRCHSGDCWMCCGCVCLFRTNNLYFLSYLSSFLGYS